MKILDVWFTKPRLYMSSGWWFCASTRSDEWRATGQGRTPQAAYEQMKQIIVRAYARSARKVEFA